MTWPTYPEPIDIAEIRRFESLDPDARGTFSAAVDVWRDGNHLWRSYSLDMAETIDTWADRELPPGTAGNHDAGHWRAAGVVNIDTWPVPLPAAARHVGALESVRDMLCTMLAVGQYPYAPAGFDAVPAATTMAMRMSRGKSNLTVTFTADGVTVRALITKGAEDTPAPESHTPHQCWRATLSRRATRAGAHDAELPEKSFEFSTPIAAEIKQVLRVAKAGTGITGWPAARQPDSTVWVLARAPYRLEIEPVDAR